MRAWLARPCGTRRFEVQLGPGHLTPQRLLLTRLIPRAFKRAAPCRPAPCRLPDHLSVNPTASAAVAATIAPDDLDPRRSVFSLRASAVRVFSLRPCVPAQCVSSPCASVLPGVRACQRSACLLPLLFSLFSPSSSSPSVPVPAQCVSSPSLPASLRPCVPAQCVSSPCASLRPCVPAQCVSSPCFSCVPASVRAGAVRVFSLCVRACQHSACLLPLSLFSEVQLGPGHLTPQRLLLTRLIPRAFKRAAPCRPAQCRLPDHLSVNPTASAAVAATIAPRRSRSTAQCLLSACQRSACLLPASVRAGAVRALSPCASVLPVRPCVPAQCVSSPSSLLPLLFPLLLLPPSPCQHAQCVSSPSLPASLRPCVPARCVSSPCASLRPCVPAQCVSSPLLLLRPCVRACQRSACLLPVRPCVPAQCVSSPSFSLFSEVQLSQGLSPSTTPAYSTHSACFQRCGAMSSSAMSPARSPQCQPYRVRCRCSNDRAPRI